MSSQSKGPKSSPSKKTTEEKEEEEYAKDKNDKYQEECLKSLKIQKKILIHMLRALKRKDFHIISI
jgi:hypothetical protein